MRIRDFFILNMNVAYVLNDFNIFLSYIIRGVLKFIITPTNITFEMNIWFSMKI